MSFVTSGLGSPRGLFLTGGFASGAALPGASAAEIWGYVLPNGLTASQTLVQAHAYVMDLARIHGLVAGQPLVVTPTTRDAGAVSQLIEEAGTTVTVTRQ